MAYITQSDLEEAVGGVDRLIHLTDDAGTGEVNAVPVNKAIAYAEGVFESYLRTRYSLPVPATEMVKAINTQLALLKIESRRATTDEGKYKLVKVEHDQAVALLQAISSGKAALDVPAAEETAANPASSDQILSGSTRPIFTDSKIRNY